LSPSTFILSRYYRKSTFDPRFLPFLRLRFTSFFFTTIKMWCDNCCLLFPLRAGGMVLATIMAIYSIAGGIILFNYGAFLFFHYPEAQIYGGYAMAQGAIAIVIVFVLANRSFIFTRVLYRVYPVIGILGIVRGGIMAWELQYFKDRIVWECQNGGHKWIDPTAPPPPPSNTPTTLPTTLPPAFCNQGVNNLVLVFTSCLVIDFLLMLYMCFLLWRFHTRLRHYSVTCEDFYA